jgi:hypothetical protein
MKQFVLRTHSLTQQGIGAWVGVWRSAGVGRGGTRGAPFLADPPPSPLPLSLSLEEVGGLSKH